MGIGKWGGAKAFLFVSEITTVFLFFPFYISLFLKISFHFIPCRVLSFRLAQKEAGSQKEMGKRSLCSRLFGAAKRKRERNQVLVSGRGDESSRQRRPGCTVCGGGRTDGRTDGRAGGPVGGGGLKLVAVSSDG